MLSNPVYGSLKVSKTNMLYNYRAQQTEEKKKKSLKKNIVSNNIDSNINDITKIKFNKEKFIQPKKDILKKIW